MLTTRTLIVASIMFSTAASAADYRAEPYAPQVVYGAPLPRVPQAPPVYLMDWPPQYVVDLRSGYDACGCQQTKPWAIGLQWSLRSLIGFSGLATTIANKHTGRRFHGVCPSPSLQLSAQQASITDTGRHAGGTHAQIVRCDSSSSQGLLRDTHRLWAGGVAAIEANAKAAQFRKGAHLRHQTHCKYGHSLADAYISRQQGGYIKRDCRTCWAIRQKRPGTHGEALKLQKRSKPFCAQARPSVDSQKGVQSPTSSSTKLSLVSATKIRTSIS